MRDLTFVATAGGAGKCHIHVETRLVSGRGPDGQGCARRESRLVTSTGAAVDQIAEGVYRVRSTGMVLRLADPNTPAGARSVAGRGGTYGGGTGRPSAGPASPGLSQTPPPRRGLTADWFDRPARTGFRVLVVDDDPGQAQSTATLLRASGFEVETVATVADAKAAGFAPHVVVADLSLPGQGGQDLFTWARALPSPAAVVVVTGFTVTQRLLAAERVGAAVVLLKPIAPEVLVDHIGRACQALRPGV